MALDLEFHGRTRKDVAVLAFNLLALLYETGKISDDELTAIAAATPGLTITQVP